MLPRKKAVSLRMVAEKVGLAPCSVSAILNDSPAAKAIPQTTKDRVSRAAQELNYLPNFWARSLRTKRTRIVAALAHDFGSPSAARIVAGLQSRLQQKGYLLALAHLDAAVVNSAALFQQRGIEGIVAIDHAVPCDLDLPVTAVELADFLVQSTRDGLSQLGESAAEAIVSQIENEQISRRLVVNTKLPATYFEIAPSFGIATIAQESA